MNQVGVEMNLAAAIGLVIQIQRKSRLHLDLYSY